MCSSKVYFRNKTLTAATTNHLLHICAAAYASFSWPRTLRRTAEVNGSSALNQATVDQSRGVWTVEFPIFARKMPVSRLERRQTTRQADGAVATSCCIFSRADFFVRHMNLKNSGRFIISSGQFSGKSGRD